MLNKIHPKNESQYWSDFEMNTSDNLLSFSTSANLPVSLLEKKWNGLIDMIGDDPFTVYVIYTGIFVFCYFWIIGLIYLYIDFSGRPFFLTKYKIQEKRKPLKWKVVIKVAKTIFVHHIFITIPLSTIGFYILRDRFTIETIRKIPTLKTAIIELIIFDIVYDICLYHTHRLVHTRYFYKRVHKKHHEFKAPIAISALYCSPYEHVLLDLFPLLAGPLLLNSCLIMLWTGLFTRVFWILNVHSGYHFPFLTSAEHHDWHHLKSINNFGANGLMDWLYGTNKMFAGTIEHKRDKRLYTLKCARELYPEAR